MATPTYTLIDSVTLGSSAASVTFSSISQDYGDLVLVSSAITTPAGNTLYCQVNGATSGYSYVFMRGNGSSASSGTGTNSRIFLAIADTPTSGAPLLSFAQFMDYSATDKHKTILSRGNRSDSAVDAFAQRYESTSAITSMNIFVIGNSFIAGSTFHLYGIAKAL
jgi:hypothetical protein